MKMVQVSTAASSTSSGTTGSLKKHGKQQKYNVLDSAFKNSKSVEKNNSELCSPEHQPSKIRRHSSKTVKESTIIKSLLVVVLVFFICMTPFSTTKLIKVLKGYVPCWVNTFSTIIQLSASACNPLIYGIFRKEYRKAFKIQYKKACHRMHARFSSADYSDSFSTPYYSDNKPPTLKRKEKESTAKKSALSVKSNNNDNRSDTTTLSRSHPTSQAKAVEEVDSDNSNMALTEQNTAIGSQVIEPHRKYSLPQRAVSFNDTPDMVNQTTEIVAL